MSYTIFKDRNVKLKDNILEIKSFENLEDNIELLKKQFTPKGFNSKKVSNKNGELSSLKNCYNLDENNEENLTNNIKSVFQNATIEKDISDSQRSTLEYSKTSSLNSKFEKMNFKSGKEIRENYLASLITKNIWKPNISTKKFNSIIIFDWDDTLLPTSFLSPGGSFNSDLKLTKSDRETLLKIEKEVFNLLNTAISKGDVYIITNAEKGWVEFSIKKIYPSILPILPELKIISAREKFGNIFPGNYKKWKIRTFLNLLKNVNLNLVTNLICIGDSFFEIEAGRILASKFKEAFIKTIKFKESPKLNDLLKELSVVNKQFITIYNTIRNMKIKIEKK